jgi:hypothetical protein
MSQSAKEQLCGNALLPTRLTSMKIDSGCIIGTKATIEKNSRLAPDTKIMPDEKVSASQGAGS